MRTIRIITVVAAVLLSSRSGLYAQAGRGAAPPTPRAISPSDFIGYWVSVVNEDWLYRMVTPARGDYTSVPLNAEGRKVAGAWDPAKDESEGNQCKAYGAPAIMRVPGRLHITWQDDDTLKIETDAGRQTRLLNFRAASAAPGGEWQGVSIAGWEVVAGARGPLPGGGMKVVTTKMKPGYLRKNGVPYSANAVVTEYFDRVNESNGDSWLIVKTIVEMCSTWRSRSLRAPTSKSRLTLPVGTPPLARRGRRRGSQPRRPPTVRSKSPPAPKL